MNRIVVYTSKTGFTRKYAEWIAQALGCEAAELKKTDISALSHYDQVIYGGWIMGNMVSGYDKMKPLNVRSLLVFGSGMSAPTDTVRQTIAQQNGIPEENFYYFEGGYAPEKVGFMGRTMIKMIVGKLTKKESKTQEELHMLEMVKGADHTRQDAIEPLVERCLHQKL